MKLPEGFTRGLGRALLKTKAESPHIFFVGGAIAVVGAAILACKATLKLDETLDEIQKDLQIIKEAKEQTFSDGEPFLSDGEHAKHLMHTYAKASVKLGKLYGPSIIVGGAGMAALAGSHIQLTRRNSALVATLGLVSRAFEDYRERVADEIGEEQEGNIFRGVRKSPDEEGSLEVIPPKNAIEARGREIPGHHSIFARCFDETNPNWVKNAEHNMYFVRCQQRAANDKLKEKGHLFLNEVYDSLGMEHTTQGAIYGWLWNSPINGDNFVNFHIFEVGNERFVNLHERSVWLDFNVDGVIYDLI